MDEFEKILNELDEEQLSLLLEDIDENEDMLLSERIKAKAIPELTKEDSGPTVKEKTVPRIFKIIPIAAALVVVIAGAVVAASDIVKPDTKQTTTAVTATEKKGLFDNPLMLAISLGNESLIEVLINNSLLLTQDVLEYALDFANVISYTSLQDIAKAVEESLGSTGLDELLESTLLGDSKRALQELEKRETMLMTPSEKLSFFFSAAFCDSDVIREFIEKGFDINLKDATGKTILEIGEKYGNEENVKTAEEGIE